MPRTKRELLRILPDGWELVGITGRGHYKLAKSGYPEITTSASPSCRFWLNHVRQDLQRAERAPQAA